MTAYELMIKTNHYLIQGDILSDAQKNTVTEQLLSARSSFEQARRFYMSVSDIQAIRMRLDGVCTPCTLFRPTMTERSIKPF